MPPDHTEHATDVQKDNFVKLLARFMRFDSFPTFFLHSSPSNSDLMITLNRLTTSHAFLLT